MSKLKPVSFKKPIKREPRLSIPWTRGIKSTKYWTKAEDAAIRKHYEKDGVGRCMELLPGRTYGGLTQRARKLGLTRQGKSAKWIKVAPPDEIIREKWLAQDGKKRGEVGDLADELGVPSWWLSKKARRLGLTVAHKKEPQWTNAEIALMKKVPLHDVDRCAKIFREHGFQRTPTAIMVKAKRLDLSRRYDATFSATKLAPILGIDPKGITARCISGEIKAKKRKSRRLAQQGGAPWSITRKDARAFVLKHLEQIDLRKVEKFAFIDLLTRIEA